MTADASALDPMRLALVGVPNCGKTALFNRLTGSRQKVANYAGVTVERKEGSFVGSVTAAPVPRARPARRLQPARRPRSTRRSRATSCSAGCAGEAAPELVVCVVDATNLRLNLRLVLELRDLGVPMVVALNMSDLARGRGFQIDRARARARTRRAGRRDRRGRARRRTRQLRRRARTRAAPGRRAGASTGAIRRFEHDPADAARGAPHPARHRLHRARARAQRSQRLDALVLHPVAGPVILAVLLFLVFQAVFSWAAVPMDADQGRRRVRSGARLQHALPDGALRSLLVDGVIAGRRQRAGVPAADPDPVLLHPAARGQRATCRAPPSCSTA